MEYFTKQWFLAHQPGYLQQTEDAEKARAAARRVVEAYEADPRVLAAPPELADSLAEPTDLVVLSVRRSADALVLSLGDDEDGEQYRLTFSSPQIQVMEEIKGAAWLHPELFRLDKGYQVNVLFWDNDSPLAFIPFEPHLQVLSLRCSGITCEELHWKFLKKMEANPKKEL